MSIETIDAAIKAHLDWVKRFNASLQGESGEVFDLNKAYDDKACSLGQWLSSERSHDVLGSTSHKQIKAMHATFHEIAGSIAAQLNQNAHGADLADWMAEFDNLSQQLVMLLKGTKQKI